MSAKVAWLKIARCVMIEQWKIAMNAWMIMYLILLPNNAKTLTAKHGVHLKTILKRTRMKPMIQ